MSFRRKTEQPLPAYWSSQLQRPVKVLQEPCPEHQVLLSPNLGQLGKVVGHTGLTITKLLFRSLLV